MGIKKQKILDISKELGLSHIGSCLTMLPILEEIYSQKKQYDKVVLDNAHAHLAHTLFLAYPLEADSKKIIEEYGIHCDSRICDVSGGSLGHGIGITIGLALAYPEQTIHCTVSDGSMMEGSNWEALRIINQLEIKNIKIYANFNGYTAVAESMPIWLIQEMHHFAPYIKIESFIRENDEGFEGIQGHYKKL